MPSYDLVNRCLQEVVLNKMNDGISVFGEPVQQQGPRAGGVPNMVQMMQRRIFEFDQNTSRISFAMVIQERLEEFQLVGGGR